MTYSEKVGNSERPLKNLGNIKIINIIIKINVINIFLVCLSKKFMN